MKTLTRITLLAASLAFTTLPLVTAADAPADTTTPPAGNSPGLHALARRHAVRQRLAQRLGLTADQIGQLKATRAKTATAIKAIRADASLTPDQQKAKIHATRQAALTEMRGVLTPDQQAKMGKLRGFLRAKKAAQPSA